MIISRIILGYLSAAVLLTSLILISIPFVEAYSHAGIVQTQSHSPQSNTEITPLNEEIGIEKTVLFLHAPADNKLPWGFVEEKLQIMYQIILL